MSATLALLLTFLPSASHAEPMVALRVPCMASFYGDECRGLPMANTKAFNPDALTCASWFYPLGTRLRVTSGLRSVVVTVTDRGPANYVIARGVQIDLSRGAFEQLLGDKPSGHLPVSLEVL